MDAREQRGLELSQKKPLRKKGSLWIVPSAQGHGSYVADFENTACSCPDYEERGGVCKHLWAVQHTLRREVSMSATGILTEIQTFETVAVRKTYSQDWAKYNAAQTTEKARVAELLHALCSGIEQPPQGKGRPRLLLADVVFSAAMKVYGGASCRRSVSDFEDFKARGFVTKAPSFNSVFDYLDDAKLTPLLKALIKESANPLRAVETTFAVDSSGFSTSTFDRWYDEKYGKHEEGKPRRKFLKAHVMCGVRTHVITSVEVTDGNSNDCPHLPGLLDATARRFETKEVSADKGYLSAANLEAIEAAGAAAYVPFKLNSQGSTGSETWRRLFHVFSLERERFLSRYHQRSNVETVFHMVKAKFGGAVRSKADVAQRNEVLLKVLLHNLCCLVMAMHELGLEPKFWPSKEAS